LWFVNGQREILRDRSRLLPLFFADRGTPVTPRNFNLALELTHLAPFRNNVAMAHRRTYASEL
jgi:hypothetical protein